MHAWVLMHGGHILCMLMGCSSQSTAAGRNRRRPPKTAEHRKQTPCGPAEQTHKCTCKCTNAHTGLCKPEKDELAHAQMHKQGCTSIRACKSARAQMHKWMSCMSSRSTSGCTHTQASGSFGGRNEGNGRLPALISIYPARGTGGQGAA